MKRGANIVFLFAFVGFVIVSCAKAPEVRKEEPVPTIKGIGGKITPENVDVPIAGMIVRSGEYTAVAGPDGTFAFEKGLPAGKNQVVAEKRFESGPVRRVLGVATVYVMNAPVQFPVVVRDATFVDPFCLNCHPYKDRKTRRDQIVRCLHVSGKAPKAAIAPDAPLDPSGKVTCESCHTIHAETGISHFLTASYMDGALCWKCHR